MSKLKELFKRRLKVKEYKQTNTRELKKEAEILTRDLKILLCTGIFMLKPYKNDYNQVQIHESNKDIIEKLLNSDNPFIINNEEFLGIRNFLQSILDNSLIVELNDETRRSIRQVERFCNGIQGEEYWKSKEGYTDYSK